MDKVTSHRTIAIFGSSQIDSSHSDYIKARKIASKLASLGYAIVTGGYGGIMEAANRGAREANGRSIGITTELFSERGKGNAWLDETICETDLLARTVRLIKTADGFAVLPGQAGTLAEVALLWALLRVGDLGERPIVLVGKIWENVCSTLSRDLWLSQHETSHCRIVETPEDAVIHICEYFHRLS